MDMSVFLFYFLAAVIVASAVATVANPNPIFSALYLAITMISLAFMYFDLGAQFIGGVQLIVYAGAVMVLFVIVLMLFDLGKEIQTFSASTKRIMVKLLGSALLMGTLVGGILMSTEMITSRPGAGDQAARAMTTLDLARVLFTDYVLAFEVLGFLLLVVAIGAVAVSRISGGTHAQS